MRKLASIQVIEELNPIEKADRIEVATVLGWKCVVKKGEFKVGDKIIYIEIDSRVPAVKEFEFLKERNYKVKTIKLRGQISQGLVCSIDVLGRNASEFKVGDDVTKELRVTKSLTRAEENELKQEIIQQNRISKYLKKYKWYRKLFIRKKTTKGFPKFVRKTDETRIQCCKNVLENKTLFKVTEKLDGSSATFVLVQASRNFIQKLLRFPKYEFIVCSRNMRKGLKDDGSSWWNVAKKYKIRNFLEKHIGDQKFVGLQGEVIGEKIRGNKYKISGFDFYAFNVLAEGGIHSACEFETMLNESGIKTVPLLNADYTLPDTVDEIVNYSIGKSKLYDTQREGIVVRNIDNSISFKVINPEFLLKNDE